MNLFKKLNINQKWEKIITQKPVWFYKTKKTYLITAMSIEPTLELLSAKTVMA